MDVGTCATGINWQVTVTGSCTGTIMSRVYFDTEETLGGAYDKSVYFIVRLPKPEKQDRYSIL